MGFTIALLASKTAHPGAFSPLISFLSFVLFVGYYVVLPPLLGAPPGTLFLGYHIVDGNLHHIGAGRSIGRYLAHVISAAVLCLGCFWIAFDGRKQAWHDKIAGTYVVRKEFVHYY